MNYNIQMKTNMNRPCEGYMGHAQNTNHINSKHKKGELQAKGTEKLFNKVIVENCPHTGKLIALQM